MTTPVYESVAYLAADKFAVFNPAGDSFVSEFAPGARLRADCGTDGVLLGTVAAASFEAATGRTVVTTAMDGGAALTANLAEVLHGNDLPASLCAHAALHAIGGRDALPAASTGVSGLASLATTAETQAGTTAAKAVTPAGLAASAKGLIATNTTICVATTGSDATGTGSSSAPYASIARALSSIAGKLIASGATVTVQVADGTYAVGSTIVIDHPDADKIQILGNTSAETTVAISSINTTTKTFTVVGNYVSNADATKNIQIGDIIGLNGSSTSGLNGAYVVSGVSYDGTNTVITCAAEAIASAVVGGGATVIKPCNRVNLTFPTGTNGVVVKTALKNFSGIRMTATATSSLCYGFSGINCSASTIGVKTIINGFKKSIFCDQAGTIHIAGTYCKNPYDVGIGNQLGSVIDISGYEDQTIIDGGNIGVMSNWGSFIYTYAPKLTLRGQVVSTYSPTAVNTVGNGNSFIQQ